MFLWSWGLRQGCLNASQWLVIQLRELGLQDSFADSNYCCCRVDTVISSLDITTLSKYSFGTNNANIGINTRVRNCVFVYFLW